MTDENNDYILVEVEDGVATVTLDRPKRMNALSSELLDQLAEAFMEIGDNDAIGAVLLTGSPECKKPSFAAGADIAEMAELGPMGLRDFSRHGQTVFSIIEGLSKPVIAAVNGFALGGGCELAMACHFRYASTDAVFGQPEVNLGIIPGFGGTQRLVRLIGRGRALELLLSGDSIDADEALRLGLVNRVVAPDQLMDVTHTLAAKFASKAPVARELILEAVARGAETHLEEAQAIEADLFGAAGTTEDVREGLQAFLEKRKPGWKGR